MYKAPETRITKKLICMDKDIAEWLTLYAKSHRLSIARVVTSLVLELMEKTEREHKLAQKMEKRAEGGAR
jgi:hypothetical protein